MLCARASVPRGLRRRNPKTYEHLSSVNKMLFAGSNVDKNKRTTEPFPRTRGGRGGALLCRFSDLEDRASAKQRNKKEQKEQECAPTRRVTDRQTKQTGACGTGVLACACSARSSRAHCARALLNTSSCTLHLVLSCKTLTHVHM